MGAANVSVPDIRNFPSRGLVVRDEREFFRLTQRNDIPLNSVSIPTSSSEIFGQRVTFRVPNRGIASELRLHFSLSVVVATYNALTVLEKWPYGLIQSLRVKANSTDLINTNGLALHMERCADSQSTDFTDVESTTVSAANGTYTVDFVIVVPLAFGRAELVGPVFLETDDTYMEVEIILETEAELFTCSGGTTVTATGTIYPTLTTWDVPHVVTSKGEMAVVPDLSVHSMIGTRKTYISANGEQTALFSRANGHLLRAFASVYDASAYNYLTPASSFSAVKLRWGRNMVVREHRPVRDLMLLNARWMRDVLPKDHFAIDFVAENSLRDVLIPSDVSDLELVIDLGSTSIAAGDYIELTERVIIPNATWQSAQPVALAA